MNILFRFVSQLSHFTLTPPPKIQFFTGCNFNFWFILMCFQRYFLLFSKQYQQKTYSGQKKNIISGFSPPPHKLFVFLLWVIWFKIKSLIFFFYISNLILIGFFLALFCRKKKKKLQIRKYFQKVVLISIIHSVSWTTKY